MTDSIERHAQHASKRCLGSSLGAAGVGLVLAWALSACGGGGGDVLDRSALAAAPAAAAAVSTAPAPSSSIAPRRLISSETLIDDFEGGPQVWTDYWANWGNAQIVAGAGVAGSHAMRVGTGAGGAAYNVWEVWGGSTYRITAQARVSEASETVFVGVNVMTRSGELVAQQAAPISSTSYSLATLEVTVPLDAVGATADVFVWKNAGGGYAFVDDVTFADVPAAPPPPPAGANLLSNRGFESGMTGWVDWGNAVVIPFAGMSGSSGLRVGTAAGGAAQEVPGIVAGGNYQLVAQVRVTAPGDPSYLGINMLDAAGNVVAQRAIEFMDTMFETASVQLTAPATAVKAVVFVWKNASSGHALVDDLTFAMVGAAPPPPPPPPPPGFVDLLSNPGFEASMNHWVDWGNTLVVTGAGAWGSGNALRVGTPAGGAGQDVGGIVPGALYRFAATVRVSESSETGYIGVNLVDAAGNNVAQQVIGFDNTAFAKIASAEFQAPAGAVKALVYVWKNDGAGYAFVDEFEFGSVPATPGSLVVNGGFEDQLAHWQAVGVTAVTDAASGTYAVALGSGTGLLQYIPLAAGQTYRLSARTRMIGEVGPGIFDTNGVSVVIRDASFSNIIGHHPLPLPPSGGSYSYAAVEFTVPANAATSALSVYVEGGAAGGGLLLVDDISVVPL